MHLSEGWLPFWWRARHAGPDRAVAHLCGAPLDRTAEASVA
jgi:hypothetical protein